MKENESKLGHLMHSKVPRRGFFAVAGGAALAGALDRGKESTVGGKLEANGLTVYTDREGLPIVSIAPDNNKIWYEKEPMREIREYARKTGEPELVEVIKLPPKSVDYTLNSDSLFKPKNPERHVVIPNLPPDVLTEPELQAMGINIIQASSTSLYIREGAFKQGGPLAAFNGTGRKMTIALLDTPAVSRIGVNDKKYEAVSGVLEDSKEENISVYRRREYERIAMSLVTLKNEPKNNEDLIDSHRGLTSTEIIILEAKQSQHINGLLTDEELLYKMSGEPGRRLLGQYESPDRNNGVAAILLAVGNSYIPEDFATLYVTPRGEFKINSLSGQDLLAGRISTLTPSQSHTYPDPGDFAKYPFATKSNGVYLYSTHTSGFALRHEIAHDELITQLRRRGSTEYDTDVRAMEGIAYAWNRWVDSGYTDDAGYYFAFSLPEGGYILTQNQRPSSAKPLAT